jgi:hypothetical protein
MSQPLQIFLRVAGVIKPMTSMWTTLFPNVVMRTLVIPANCFFFSRQFRSVLFDSRKDRSRAISLQGIYKFRVLLVRQIKELLLVQLCISRFGSDSLILLVHPFEVPENKCQIYQAGCPAHNNGDLCGDVSWFVLRLEGLRTYDITSAITNQV